MSAASLRIGGGSVNKLIVVCIHVIPRLAVIMEAASMQLSVTSVPVLSWQRKLDARTRGVREVSRVLTLFRRRAAFVRV